MTGSPNLIASGNVPSQARGFTLIELISVIVIVVILTGVAVPTLSSLAVTRSGMAGKQVLRDMTFARQRAVATGVVSWVVFNTGAKTWSILAENPASPGRAGATVINDLATGRPYTTTLGIAEYVGVNFTSCTFGAGQEVGFDWLGRPRISDSTNLAAQGSVVFSAANRVTVEPITGHIAYVP